MKVEYKKDVELRRRINLFLVQAFGLPEEDYFSRLDITNLLALKMALSDINNALTMQLTLSFVDWISSVLRMDDVATSKLRETVLKSKPGSNGYDLHFDGPIPFIAEVKCNVPINGSQRYGSAQRAGIVKDINALLSGKSKAASVTSETLKFMVFLDIPEVQSANRHFLTSIASPARPVRFIESDDQPSDPTVVYIVHISLGNFDERRQGRQQIDEIVTDQLPEMEVCQFDPLTGKAATFQQSPRQEVATPTCSRPGTSTRDHSQIVEFRLTKLEFQTALQKMFNEATDAGLAHIDVHAGALHSTVGGYPGPNHLMPTCCNVMYAEMEPGDEVLEAPPKKLGANVNIRYLLPRIK